MDPRKAAEWFEHRSTPMPGAREMYRMAATALRAQAVAYESLIGRGSFPDDQSYVAYLLGVIRKLESIRQDQRTYITKLEDKLDGLRKAD